MTELRTSISRYFAAPFPCHHLRFCITLLHAALPPLQFSVCTFTLVALTQAIKELKQGTDVPAETRDQTL